MKTAKEDYQTEAERRAYSQGIFARANGLMLIDCPENYDMFNHFSLHLAWVRGYEEKGSIKRG